MAEAYSYMPLTYLVWFTAFTQSYSDIFIEGNFEDEGWKVKERSKVNRDLGSGNVKVERYELLYSWVGDDVTWTWEVAEIGDKFLFTVWKWSYGTTEYDMNVKKVIPF